MSTRTRQLPPSNPDAMDTQPDETRHPVPSSTPPLQALCPTWSSTPQGHLPARHSWASRGPPPGPVTPNLIGSPAPPLPLEIRRPHAGKCLTTYPLQLGAGPPRAVGLLPNTTASGAGIRYCPALNPLLRLSVRLILFAYKTPLFGAFVFLPSKTTSHSPSPLSSDANPRWHFMFLLSCWPKPWCYLLFLIGLTLMPLTCLG